MYPGHRDTFIDGDVLVRPDQSKHDEQQTSTTGSVCCLLSVCIFSHATHGLRHLPTAVRMRSSKEPLHPQRRSLAFFESDLISPRPCCWANQQLQATPIWTESDVAIPWLQPASASASDGQASGHEQVNESASGAPSRPQGQHGRSCHGTPCRPAS